MEKEHNENFTLVASSGNRTCIGASVCLRLFVCSSFPVFVTDRVSSVKKGKVLPYLLPSVGPGDVPGVQTVSPRVTLNHPTGGRLPLLSARPAVTCVPFTRWRQPYSTEDSFRVCLLFPLYLSVRVTFDLEVLHA